MKITFLSDLILFPSWILVQVFKNKYFCSYFQDFFSSSTLAMRKFAPRGVIGCPNNFTFSLYKKCILRRGAFVKGLGVPSSIKQIKTITGPLGVFLEKFNPIVVKDVKSCDCCCYDRCAIAIVRVGGMPWHKTCATYYHANWDFQLKVQLVSHVYFKIKYLNPA